MNLPSIVPTLRNLFEKKIVAPARVTLRGLGQSGNVPREETWDDNEAPLPKITRFEVWRIIGRRR